MFSLRLAGHNLNMHVLYTSLCVTVGLGVPQHLCSGEKTNILDVGL